MYFSLGQAIRDNLDYEKTATGDWRVTFNGAFNVSAESSSPNDASYRVEKELERLLADWILRAPDTPPAVLSAGRPGGKKSSKTSRRRSQ